jgi:RNA polymerase sigma factor (sigma-70 family)
MGAFATTRWSLIVASRGSEADARAALDELCRSYRPAVLAYVRHRHKSREEAEDLTQAFFASLLEHRIHQSADPARGRFRVYLLTALRRFLYDQNSAAWALKRGAGLTDAIAPEVEETVESDEMEPERAFERRFALALLERALSRLESEAQASGKGERFAQVREFLIEAPDASEYERVAAALGVRRNTLAVSVHRLRHRYRELVREELGEITASPEDIELEWRALRSLLGGAA